jgi:hypothetical protein
VRLADPSVADAAAPQAGACSCCMLHAFSRLLATRKAFERVHSSAQGAGANTDVGKAFSYIRATQGTLLLWCRSAPLRSGGSGTLWMPTAF